jgi:hypothetical protein
MPDDDMKTELERLRKENDALKKGVSEGTRMKVSGKVASPFTGWDVFQ